MAASAQDKFMEVGSPGTATTLSSPGYTSGVSTSITVGSTSNWPTATGIVFAIDEATTDSDGNEVRVDGTYNEFVGTVASATSITNVDYVAGDAERSYSAGATTRVYIPVSATRENRMAQGMVVEHNQNGTHAAVTATSLVASGAVQGSSVVSTGDIQHRSVSLETIRSELEFDYVASGCVWSGDSYGGSLAASMTSGVVYIGGRRVAISAVTARAFTASKDTYIDVGTDGTVDYTEVTNNAASPALAASHIRLGIVVSGAGSIAAAASINQGQEDRLLPIASSVPYQVTDSLGNLICPRDPSRRVIGYRQRTASSFATTSASAVQVTELSAPIIVPSGRKIRATFNAHDVTASTTTQVWQTIWDGTVGSGTKLHETQIFESGAGVNFPATCAGPISTLSAGSHTINAGFHNNGGGGATSTLGNNMYILIELI